MRNTFAAKFLVQRSYLVSSFFARILTFRSAHTQPKHKLRMNEAFLRYEKGDDVFNISFRYVDEVTRIDRQFNFSRQATESVNNFLTRVNMNVCKFVNKKVRKILVNLRYRICPCILLKHILNIYWNINTDTFEDTEMKWNNSLFWKR